MAEKKNELGFEQNLQRLDEIIRLLEKDSVPLDELLRLYEEGVGLVRLCNGQLDDAQQKVKMLNGLICMLEWLLKQKKKAFLSLLPNSVL